MGTTKPNRRLKESGTIAAGGPRAAIAAWSLALGITGADFGSASTEFDQLADAKTRGFLNELSARRRVTTLFPNRQSAYHGVQENFVNTSAGNLTFLVRDIVRVGGMPIVMGRVYDSALSAQDDAAGDFGPGWKLSVREAVAEDGDGLAYTNASNVTYALVVDDGGDIVPASPALAPVSSGSVRETGRGGRHRRVEVGRHDLAVQKDFG